MTLPAMWRPDLMSVAMDALAHPLAVFERGPSPLLATANAAFQRLVETARLAGVQLVEETAGRLREVGEGATHRYGTSVPSAGGAVELDCHVRHDVERDVWVWWAVDVTVGRRAQVRQDELAVDALEREAELTRSNEDLERFASIASHDLSEPLRMVASFADLLARRYRGRLDEQADAYIAYILEGATRMRALIDALLAFAELRASELRREDVDLAEVVEEVRANLLLALEESGARVEVGTLPTVRADREAMRQVLQNLLANAVKFRGVDPPYVTVTSRHEGDEWVIDVADNGIGVPEEHRERIFDMFGRLHPRAAFPGSGLGLAMSRRAIEHHGGRIWADVAPGGGSVFRFTLPEGTRTR